jgi:hypothetical protein
LKADATARTLILISIVISIFEILALPLLGDASNTIAATGAQIPLLAVPADTGCLAGSGGQPASSDRSKVQAVIADHILFLALGVSLNPKVQAVFADHLLFVALDVCARSVLRVCRCGVRLLSAACCTPLLRYLIPYRALPSCAAPLCPDPYSGTADGKQKEMLSESFYQRRYNKGETVIRQVSE